MTETASYLPQKEGAGSIMHLRSHIKVNIKAYQAQWVIKYLDPRRAPWKEVLDHWIALADVATRVDRAGLEARQVSGMIATIAGVGVEGRHPTCSFVL